MPGSGKSCAGRILARLTGRVFADLDTLYLEDHGLTPAQAIRRHGEAYFRQGEEALLGRVARRKNIVVACGGGTLVSDRSRKKAEAAGVVVHLATTPAVLARRLKDASNHPLLDGSDLEDRLRLLLDSRRPAYEKASVTVDTDRLTPYAAAVVVAQKLFPGFAERGAAGSSVVSGRELCVPLGPRSYPVRVVESRWVGHLSGLLAETAPGRRPFVVGDARVLELYGEQLGRAVPGASRPFLRLPEGERGKGVSLLEGYLESLLSGGVARDSVLVALGGGSALDAAGFTASIYMRGIPCVYVATTLLAAVDASVGGKTAMDLADSKNIPGTFAQPAGVLIPVDIVGEEMRQRGSPDGYAELLKTWLLCGRPPESARWLVRPDGSFYRSRLSAAILEAVAFKASVVTRDEYDLTGVRAALNLGHTFGHAVESASNYRVSHGRAVAWGLVVAVRMSEELGVARPGLAGRVEESARRLGLWPPPGSVQAPEALVQRIASDKKAAGRSISLVLIESPGRPVVREMEIEVAKKLMSRCV